MEFNFEEFKRNFDKVAVHCKTEEEAQDFRIAMKKHGVVWKYTFWDSCRRETCYTCFYESNNYQMIFYNLNYLKSKGYTILEWSDYMKKEFTKSDLENGMIVEQRNGDRRIVLNNNMIGLNGFNFLNNYKENLTEYAKHTELDIVKVYKVKEECSSDLTYLLVNQNYLELEQLESYLELVWEREKEEKKEMTLEEIENELGYKIKIVNNKN